MLQPCAPENINSPTVFLFSIVFIFVTSIQFPLTKGRIFHAFRSMNLKRLSLSIFLRTNND